MHNIFINCLLYFSIVEEKAEILCYEWHFFISGLTASSLLFGVTRSLLALYILVNSSQTLHNKMLKTILRVPVLFFDRNPAGKSDTNFLSKYILTHLVLCHVLVFENGRDSWKKSLCVFIHFLQKSSLIFFSYWRKFEYRHI